MASGVFPEIRAISDRNRKRESHCLDSAARQTRHDDSHIRGNDEQANCRNGKMCSRIALVLAFASPGAGLSDTRSGMLGEINK